MRVACGLAAVVALVCWPGHGEAKIVEQPLEYQDAGITCRGFLAYDDAGPAKRPGVLVVHEWWGLNDYAKQRARQLAEMGYVALAADYYGDGKVATTREQAMAATGAVRGTPLMRTRGVAALAALAAQPNVDTTRLAAIGFCFGGTGVLELAYSGADLKGIVSFHGGLLPPHPEDAAPIKPKVLICHGDADPGVKPDAVRACLDGLTKAKVDWQFISFAGVVHAFTNPASGNDPSKGAAYNEQAANRSWAAMQAFFKEIFA